MNKEEIKEILDNIFKDENVNGFILSDERYKELKDYITNLQQENEKLNRMCELYNAELSDYKSRCEKAVEYINKHTYNPSQTINDERLEVNPKYLLNILNGSDENETNS